MNNAYFSIAIVALFALGIAAAYLPLPNDKLEYPNTKRVDHVDTYFGTHVPDPYRWLEDDKSSETAQWVTDENKVTFGYLEEIPYRQKIKSRLEKLVNYPRYSAPF